MDTRQKGCAHKYGFNDGFIVLPFIQFLENQAFLLRITCRKLFIYVMLTGKKLKVLHQGKIFCS
jgi:hypothetical protein